MTKKKPGFAESLKILGKALAISIKVKSVLSIIVSIAGFAAAFLPMLIAIALKNFSNEIQTLYGTGPAVMTKVLSAFAILSALYIIQLLWQNVQAYFEVLDKTKITHYMRERVLRCTCDVKYKYLENYDNFHDKVKFVNSDANDRVAGSMQTIIVWFQNIITFISIIVTLLEIDVWIVVILCVACIPSVVISYVQKNEEYYGKTMWSRDSLLAMRYFFEAVWAESINEIRFLGIFNWRKKKFQERNASHITSKNKMTRKHVFVNSLADMLRGGVYIFILILAAKRIFDNPAVGIGTFMLVLTMSSQLQDITARILVTAAKFVSDVSYLRDFFYLDELEYELRRPNAEPYEKYDIDFQNVKFSYPNTEREIFSNLNVQIKAGEKVAIVGENGSGKSTFVSLLCALHEPDEGSISLGGNDLCSDLSRTRKTISAVFQDFAHYESTLRENITASSDRNASDSEIMELCEMVGSAEVIAEQAAGLDEVVGKFSSTGNNLSGGQWQKIALTRCAYRSDARIMVLDEPTAALDPLAEAELYRNFASITGARTTILISHRLGIAKLVDRILVFDNGAIVEDGDHETLMGNDGIYAKMYQSQSQWYE